MTRADTPEGVAETRLRFDRKWEFDRVAADLVRQRYAGTPLLWNARVFNRPLGGVAKRTAQRPLAIEATDWGRCGKNSNSTLPLRST